MKKIIKNIFALSLLGVVFASCKKDEDRITFNGGTDPVLSAASTADLVLTKPNAQQIAMKFTWTNPEYQFTTGISSQDVTYALQVDTTGSNFTTPGAPEVAISKDLGVTLTDSVLNALMSKFGSDGLVVDVPHNMEFRIKSTLTGNTVPLYSNVIKVVVTPYLDVAVPVPFTDQLFIIGSATPGGWTNPVDVPTQQFSKVSATMWEITIPMTAGQAYLAIPDNGSWSNKYAVHDNTVSGLSAGGDFGYNGSNGYYNSDIPGPSVGGTYKIVFNFKTGKFTATKL